MSVSVVSMLVCVRVSLSLSFGERISVSWCVCGWGGAYVDGCSSPGVSVCVCVSGCLCVCLGGCLLVCVAVGVLPIT